MGGLGKRWEKWRKGERGKREKEDEDDPPSPRLRRTGDEDANGMIDRKRDRDFTTDEHGSTRMRRRGRRTGSCCVDRSGVWDKILQWLAPNTS
jgi:hypothetical protein